MVPFDVGTLAKEREKVDLLGLELKRVLLAGPGTKLDRSASAQMSGTIWITFDRSPAFEPSSNVSFPGHFNELELL
jgi:hypothetical protein